MSLNPFRSLAEAPTVSQFTEVLGILYPAKYAASWDNVGLLIEPIVDKPLKHILLTNDLTEMVCHEAIERKAELIISYHPPLFRPLKTIRGIQGDWKERVVAKCIRNDIAVYSPHTIADAIADGVNDYLLRSLDLLKSVPIEPDIMQSTVGAGRKAVLRNPLSIQSIIGYLKNRLKTNVLRVSYGSRMNENTLITNIGVCVGSGASLLRNLEVELVITGEMSHHEVLDIIHQRPSCSIILCEHSTSERAYLESLSALISENNSKIEVIISREDTEPIKFL